MEESNLVAFKDYQPMTYLVDVQVPQFAGQQGKGQVAINDRPFLIQRITHIITSAGVPIWLLIQDGIYRIDWSLYEQKRFFKGAVPNAVAQFGNARTGIWLDLPSPVAMVGNETLHVGVMNDINRGADFVVQVQFHGIEQVKNV